MKLYKGDCLEVMKTIEDNSIDAIITDPPYGTTACKWDSVINFELMWEQLNRIIKPNGAIVLFAQSPFDKVLGVSNIKSLRYEWIWEKTKSTGHLNAKKMPMKSHENILVFYKKLPTYNPQKTSGHERKVSKAESKPTGNHSDVYGSQVQTTYDSTERYPRSVQVFSKDEQKSRLHPTQKPVKLMEYLIKTYTNENETVLDFTMGSGSTGVACVNTNRNFIGIEMDDNYFEIAQKRIKEAEYKLF